MSASATRVLPAVVAVAAGLLLMLGGALAGSAALTGLGSLSTYLGLDRLLRTAGRVLPERAGGLPATLSGLLAVEQSLILVLVLRSGITSGSAKAVVVVSVVTLSVVRAGWAVLHVVDGELRRNRILVRNLDLPTAELPAPSRLLWWQGLAPTSWPGLLLSWGCAAAVAALSPAVLEGSAVLAVVLSLAVAIEPLRGLVTLVRAPRGAAHLALVQSALQRLAPEAVLYFGGGPGSVYAANTWLTTLERIRQPAFVFVRDPAALARLDPTSVPVVCGPGRDDVAALCSQASLRVSLFAVNETENLRLLRNPRLRSAFIGHGDSDKSGSVSPLSRSYDEVWVAGPAARQRYREADVGVREAAIRQVGRPQVAAVDRSSAGPPASPYRILYAPTWEGLDEGNHESSLQTTGERLVSELLSLPDVRVVYRPHPRTGSRSPAVARASRNIVDQLRSRGGPHQVLTGDGVDLVACFNDADALVSDVSSVIPDFLASGKPYFMVDVRGLPEDQFRREVPTAAAAYVVGPAAEGLLTGLADARGADTLSERRQELREQLLGPAADDPFQVFSHALDALALTRQARLPLAGAAAESVSA